MNTLEIVFGYSCEWSMRQGCFDNILMFNTLFNIGSLKKVAEYEIEPPPEICYEEKNYLFEQEVKVLKEAIKNKAKIRIWTSHYDSYSYLVFLYVCSIIKDNDSDIYVVYSEEYNKECLSPSMMRSNELEEAATLEHKLTKEDILKYTNEWEKIVAINSPMRVMENSIVKSVPLDYYDFNILEELKKLGEVRMARLVANLMSKIRLGDGEFVYLINRLIKMNKITIVKESKERVFDNIITIV